MSQTKKVAIFFLSFFITLIAISLFFQSMNPLMVKMDESVMFNIISPLFTTIGLVLFIILQALIRYIFYRKILNSNTSFVSANISKFGMKEKLIPYAFLILIHLAPFLGKIVFDYTFMIRILLFIGSVIIIELLLRISNRSTKVFFQRNGILITGFDGRIEIPFGVHINIINDSGFYSYNDIEEYEVFPDRMELKLINNYGKIVFMANGELKRQVTGLMVQNKIPVKNVTE
ncbi:hypothetical protein [Proteiniborus sp. MB09-C3]|uniref:hypothetical protein n=1 Tax=Proteiniborus sp. MB09-C3 TaxID=3050072 RepID=UPI002555832F|nr:hypothetical protein [Proteiniborus sp. MB09-C3]WIV13492.1 hypothetical protein QO263_07225 [Proteiniborus sp. MB09-C3]